MDNAVQRAIKGVVKITKGRSVGAGTIIRRYPNRTLILSLAHVTGHGDVMVEGLLGSEFQAHGHVRWWSPATDLALVEITGPFGQAVGQRIYHPQLNLGETVYTVGHPDGNDFTASRGIVSAMGRSVQFPGRPTMVQMIQTDAYVGKGSSGGPMVDEDGLVVGIVQSFMPVGRVGYAIPIGPALRNVEDENYLEDL